MTIVDYFIIFSARIKQSKYCIKSNIQLTQNFVYMFQNPLYALLPVDQADLVVIIIIVIPIAYVLSLIYNKYIILTITITFSIAFQSYLYKDEKWFLWGQQQLVYLIILLAPRKYVGHIVLVQSFTAISIMHLYRLYTAYGQNNVDVSVIFMMQIFNYIGTAYNYQRGIENQQYFTEDQIKRIIQTRPNYITYLGYVNFLPGSLVGPAFQFKDYECYLHKTGDYANIPNTIHATIKQIVIFIATIAVYFSMGIFQLDVVATQEFDTYNYAYKLFYIVMCITYIELKYVTVWALAIVGMRASGITYNPQKNVMREDGTILQYNFGKIESNGIRQFFLNPSIKIKVQNWNISIQVALKRYIYENIYNPRKHTDQKSRKRSQFFGQFATVITSALWHGLYPGYYISFFHWILYIQITQQIFRLSKKEGTFIYKAYEKHSLLTGIIENLLATFVLTYFGGAFHLITWERILAYLRYTYCLPYFILYIAFYLVVVKRILAPRGRKLKDKSRIEENKGEAKKTQ